MTVPHKRKLIEVAIPLEDINAAAAHEKMPGVGAHPRGLHHYWARRPLSAARAILFAQLVDDPSSRIDELMADSDLVRRAKSELKDRLKSWRKDRESGKISSTDDAKPNLEEIVAEVERERLFDIIRSIVAWENFTNEEKLSEARAEIERCFDGDLPSVYDPFSGGGSIPSEAQRLGLPAFGSDLNPVAVMIGKAMIEIPRHFKDMKPVQPDGPDRQFYRNGDGIAEDVSYYGRWVRDSAISEIGHLYPKAHLPKNKGGGRPMSLLGYGLGLSQALTRLLQMPMSRLFPAFC